MRIRGAGRVRAANIRGKRLYTMLSCPKGLFKPSFKFTAKLGRKHM